MKDGIRNGDGNGNGGPQTCEECFDALTEAQMTAFLEALDVTSEVALCLGIEDGESRAELLFNVLTSTDVGLDRAAALDILDCLGLNILM